MDFLLTKEGADKVEPTTFKVDKKYISSYVGTYTSDQLPIDLKLFVEGEALRAQGDGQSADRA